MVSRSRLEKHLVDVTPGPLSAWFCGTHEGVPARLEVRGRVGARGAVTASDVPAGQADPQTPLVTSAGGAPQAYVALRRGRGTCVVGMAAGAALRTAAVGPHHPIGHDVTSGSPRPSWLPALTELVGGAPFMILRVRDAGAAAAPLRVLGWDDRTPVGADSASMPAADVGRGGERQIQTPCRCRDHVVERWCRACSLPVKVGSRLPPVIRLSWGRRMRPLPGRVRSPRAPARGAREPGGGDRGPGLCTLAAAVAAPPATSPAACPSRTAGDRRGRGRLRLRLHRPPAVRPVWPRAAPSRVRARVAPPVCDGNRRGRRTAAQRRTKPDNVRAGKAYGPRANRAHLRRRDIRCTIPEKTDGSAIGRSSVPAVVARPSSTRTTTGSGTRSGVGSTG
ncbi:hypothetical protein SVIRM249S_07042 [Streptomyces viridochromogenes]